MDESSEASEASEASEVPVESSVDDDPGIDPLFAWALASFHAAVLIVVPLALVHAVAPVALGGVLGRLDTLVGVGLYSVLWGSTWWSNRRYLATSDFEDVAATIRVGARWGAVTGLPLLACVVVAALVVTNPFFAALLLVVGGVAALLVGAVVGSVLAGVDVALDRVAREDGP
ncbi:hypothetical protein [Salinigranum salinum]|uniref:hypothetical protein n=1 Tax=Salinigranum salinum TaxID=1364937 RepID=UPI0012612ABE|nr:hypothetical protein [Salinigranum salinum]